MWATPIQLQFGEERSPADPLRGRDPQLVFVFESSLAFDKDPMSARLAKDYPDAVVFGCSTGSAIDGGFVSDEGCAALAVGFERTRLRVATHHLADFVDSREAGRSLGKELWAVDLSAVLVFSDGLSTNGSALVLGLIDVLGHTVPISGGLAGDGSRFSRTFVYTNGRSHSHQVVAVGLYGEAIRVVHASAGGWDVFGPRREITRSRGNVLFELDGKPALDLYERYLGEEAAELPASGLLYPLQIFAPDQPENPVVRTILSVDRVERSLTFAGDIPQGWYGRLMRGHLDKLIDSASEAASAAVRSLTYHGEALCPTLCLTVSCVGRRLLLGQRAEEEVVSVSRALGSQVPQIGFYSYGEIVSHPQSGICGFHNQTITLTLLAELS